MSVRSAAHAAARVRRVAAVGQTVNAAESLARTHLYADDGILRGQAVATDAPLARRSRRLATILDHPRTATALSVTNLVCGLAALAFADRRAVRTATAVTSTAVANLTAQRNPYGRDGSDQMQRVIQGYDAISALVVDPERADDLFLRAVNAQLAISYAASGLIKLVSSDWRSGRAFAGVMRTSMYGDPRVSRLLDRFPFLGTLVCWQTILWETAFPVIYLLPDRLSRPTLAFAKVFHLAIGHFMGLPRFVWAFSATHPAAEYVVGSRRATPSAPVVRLPRGGSEIGTEVAA